MLRIAIILISFLLTTNDDMQKGIDFFNARAENAKGMQADETNVDKAIAVFETQLSENKNIETAGAYYLKCLNFKGRFALTDESEKKKIFNKAIEKGNELIKQFPTNGPIRFELMSSLALLAEVDGIFKSIKNDVLKQMLYHSEMLIKYDSMYNTCAGWKSLAVLNYKTPNIPLLLTWPNKEFAKTLLQKVLSYFPISVQNNFYYAEALLENNEKAPAKIYFQLVLKLPSRKDCPLEDEYFKAKARKYLDKMS